jgi:hypothetical protein
MRLALASLRTISTGGSGHSDIGTTIRNYGHLEESFLRDAAERAEVAIFGRAESAT